MKIYNNIFGISHLFSMSTRERCVSNFKKVAVPKTRIVPAETAAVLIPMCNINDEVSLLFTVRANNLKYSGQISFPGGKTDKGETALQTALRETKEEIGIPYDKVDVWCQGPAVPGRDNKIMVTPVVGIIHDLKAEDFDINTREVSEVFAVSLETLCNPKNQFYTHFKNGFILPVFVADEYKIWGLTAYLTHLFLSSLLPKDVYSNNQMYKKDVLK